jgi:EAL and modified HD-GYP domain-containing signal transduction protein
VRDAVNFIGRKHLQRRFNVLLYAGDDKAGLSSPLLQTAAKRGRLMELLAHQSMGDDGGVKEETAFLVGMASMFDALLNRPCEEIVRELRLDDEISVALLKHEGSLGALLQIAELLDAGDFPEVCELVRECGITVEATARAELEAFRWVQKLSTNSVGD